jgi:hypothetical protein
MAEWLKALVLKTRVAARRPQVQILLPPPIFRIRILGDYCLAPPLAGNPTASAIKTRNKRENNSGLYEPLLFFIFFVLSIFN